MFLTFTPASSAEEQLDIYIEFPDFYGINVTTTSCCKTIGLVGFNYTGYVIVGAPNKEVNLTNKTLEIKCSPRDTENLEPDSTLYSYNDLACVRIHDTISLSEKLNATLLGAGESKSFPINVFFHETGFHELRWKEKEESKWWIKSISIIEPIEYEKLTKQAEVLEAEKKSAEASESTSKWTKGLAIVTASLAIITFLTLMQIIKDRKKQDKDIRETILSILLADFNSNKSLLEDFQEEMENHSPVKLNELLSVYLGFRDDGWTVFKTQGGLKYIGAQLYQDIQGYYNSQYKIQKKLPSATDLGRYLPLIDEIKKIKEKNDDLRKKIGDLIA
jgi:hypothetical protein